MQLYTKDKIFFALAKYMHPRVLTLNHTYPLQQIKKRLFFWNSLPGLKSIPFSPLLVIHNKCTPPFSRVRSHPYQVSTTR